MHPSTLVQAWQAAADDLEIKIMAPYVLTLKNGEEVHADILVKDFGPTLVATEVAEETFFRMGDQIVAEGYGYSVFCGEELAYDRKYFVEILKDLGLGRARGSAPSVVHVAK